MARRTLSLELLATLFFAVTLGFLEAGTVSVFLKRVFDGTTDRAAGNLAVVLAGSASEIANIVSFGWIAMSHARPKVRFINCLQAGVVVCVGCIAFVPQTGGGLWTALALVMLARICWSGIVTLRTSIWRSNYPREVRARVVGRISIITQIVIATAGLGVGAALDWNVESFRVLAPLMAMIGIVGIGFYGRIRPRGERLALVQERAQPRAAGVMRPWMGIVSVHRILRSDRRFAQFMAFMFLLGLGNLMVVPTLVLALNERFNLGDDPFKASVLVTTLVPSILMPLAVPMWASLLDRAHVVKFRAIHGWAFVLASTLFTIGAATLSYPIVVAGSVAWGIATGGGAVAWNIGHTDFSPPGATSHYMATHVTLNGIRGLIAPLLAVGMYHWLSNHRDALPVEPAAMVLGVTCVLSVSGTMGFAWLRRSMNVAGRPPEA